MKTALPPACLVIFGITGDLAQRKLLPALHTLATHHYLSDSFRLVGITRKDIQAEELFTQLAQRHPHLKREYIAWLQQRTTLVQMDLLNVADYQKLGQHLDTIEAAADGCLQRLFYLAIPAQTYPPIIERLGAAQLQDGCSHGHASRLLVEKPFGYDLTSAKELIELMRPIFTEEQTFRIDHYLAKETVQNILTFRFQNALFRKTWNNHHISAITIRAHEQIGIEGRAHFYEQTGALRDLIQSHLLQILALVTMEEPSADNTTAIHVQKTAALHAMQPVRPDAITTNTVRGQYEGYRSEVANSNSNTETYAAIKLFSTNPRWQHVPFVLETGKALARKTIDITITFDDDTSDGSANTLTFNIQPAEGIGMLFNAKQPGLDHQTEQVTMHFDYTQGFEQAMRGLEAYERVIADAMRGDRLLFATSEEILAAWTIVQPVLDEWQKNSNGLLPYKKGVDSLLENDFWTNNQP